MVFGLLDNVCKHNYQVGFQLDACNVMLSLAKVSIKAVIGNLVKVEFWLSLFWSVFQKWTAFENLISIDMTIQHTKFILTQILHN